MKIAITGHRPNKLGNDYDLTSPLIVKIEDHIRKILGELHLKEGGDITLITGMALGIDTLFAKMAIANNTPFTAAIPCKGHELKWPQKSQEIYRKILSSVLCTTHYTSLDLYRPQLMQLRNEWMVNSCDILIAVWDGTSGGTCNCVQYAKKKEKKIIYIDPKLYI